MNGAEVLVRELESLGVKTLFGYPGGAIMPFYDALVGSDLQHVLVRHEQAAALAAAGMARVTGEVGVCVGTSGPGATNLITGVADAHADSVPLVVLTGQVPMDLMGTDAFQEVDVFGMTLGIVKHSYVVRSGHDLRRVLREAFWLAREGRPGPVWVDLPKDVLSGPADLHAQDRLDLVLRRTPDQAASLRDSLARAASMLERSERPLAYVGGGVASAGCEEELVRFLEEQQLPAVTTLRAVGSVPTEHPMLLGMLGMHGTAAANEAVQEADLLLCLGARFDDRATGRLERFAPEASVIHVDIDVAELGKLRRPAIGVAADLSLFLERFRPEPTVRRQWLERAFGRRLTHHPRTEGPIHAPSFLRDLTREHPGATVTCDVGQHQMWVAQAGYFTSARQHLTSGGLGTMGFSLPSAIGAALARPNEPCLAISGDGSFLMNVQELATIKRLALPIRMVVIDNRMLGMVRQWQDLFFEGRRSQVTLEDNPEFADVAEAFGIPAFELARTGDIPAALDRLRGARGPILCHVRVDPEDGAWPLVPPGAANHEMLEPSTTSAR